MFKIHWLVLAEILMPVKQQLNLLKLVIRLVRLNKVG